MDLLNFINDAKDKSEVALEFQRIEYYKNLLLTDKANVLEVQLFIDEIVEKYRKKIEVHNYYNNPKNDIHYSQYDTLCIIEQMIRQYIVVKYFEKKTI